MAGHAIGVTGSSGKTTTTALLAHILSAHGRVGSQHGFNGPVDIQNTIIRSARDSDYVVVEAGIGPSRTMEDMADALQPDVAIVTMVAVEHKSEFRTVQAIATEKGKLVAALPSSGLALLNGDDPLVAGMADRTTARVVTFGREPHNTYRMTAVEAAFPDRLTLELAWDGGRLPLKTGYVGQHFALPTVAAACTALELGVPPRTVAAQIASFEPLIDRCGVVEIPNGPTFIVDTRKAPQHSLGLAFDIVARSTLRPRRIVLGQISDGKGSSEGQYRKAYKLALEAAEQVIFVGENAHRSKASEQERQDGRFLEFRTPQQAADYLRDSAEAGEIILLKGSSNLHLERIAMCWKTEIRCWEPKCGLVKSCFSCRRYNEPFETHKGRRKSKRLRGDSFG